MVPEGQQIGFCLKLCAAEKLNTKRKEKVEDLQERKSWIFTGTKKLNIYRNEKVKYLQTQKIVEGRRSWRLGIYKARIYENIWGRGKRGPKNAQKSWNWSLAEDFWGAFLILLTLYSARFVAADPCSGSLEALLPLMPVKVFSVWGFLGFVEEIYHLWNRSTMGSTPAQSPSPSHDIITIQRGGTEI